MAEQIAQHIWYMDEKDNRRDLVVRQGDSLFRLESGILRGPDPERSGVTLSVPLHRVLMIEDFATQGGQYDREVSTKRP